MKSGVLSLYQGVHGSGCRVQNAGMCREMCTVKLYKGQSKYTQLGYSNTLTRNRLNIFSQQAETLTDIAYKIGPILICRRNK